MEITLKGEPKEIAALVLAVQERQANTRSVDIGNDTLINKLTTEILKTTNQRAKGKGISPLFPNV